MGVLPAIIDAFKRDPTDDSRTNGRRAAAILDGRLPRHAGRRRRRSRCVDGALRGGRPHRIFGRGRARSTRSSELARLTQPAHHSDGLPQRGLRRAISWRASATCARRAPARHSYVIAAERDRLEPRETSPPPATQPGLFASVFPPDGGMFPSLAAEVMPCRVDGVEAMI